MVLQGELEPHRLTPAMSSRKLHALRFIKFYWAKWGHSPTLGELASELSVSRKRAYDLVHQLAREQMIKVTAGKARGIRLVDRGEELSEADVLVRLVAMGWTIGKDDQVIIPPVNLAFPRPPLTEKGLPELPYLDHSPDAEGSACGPGKGTNGEIGEAGARARAAAPARGTAGGNQGRLGEAASAQGRRGASAP